MGEPVLELSKKYTYVDYLKWEGDTRWELIGGFPQALAAPTPKHQRISRRIVTQFENYLQDKSCEVFNAPFDVIFAPSSEHDSTKENIVQPDILVICDPDKITERGCEGSPDLIVEILSPRTFKRDLNDKFALYEQEGVREYWIVSPGEASIVVYLLGESNRYREAGIYSSTDSIAVNVLKQFSIDLNPVFK